jgi:heme-degrading monooxygenase HmoA
MYSRIVSLTLKPNAGPEFTRMLERTVLPVLRAQPGFRDELLLVVPGGPEVLAISIWDSKEDAERYSRSAFPDVLTAVGQFIEGAPRVGSYLLTFSTAHRVELGEVPMQAPNTTPVPGVGGG